MNRADKFRLVMNYRRQYFTDLMVDVIKYSTRGGGESNHRYYIGDLTSASPRVFRRALGRERGERVADGFHHPIYAVQYTPHTTPLQHALSFFAPQRLYEKLHNDTIN